MDIPSGATCNFIAIANTIGSWGIMVLCLILRPDLALGMCGLMVGVVIFVFAAERGFRHLDFKLGTGGVIAKIDEDGSVDLAVKANVIVQTQVDPANAQ